MPLDGPSLFFGTSGPTDGSALIALVGEAWGESEEHSERPFIGTSGQELDRMLLEAGIPRASCFATNVVTARPPNNELWRWFDPADTPTSPALYGLNPSAGVRRSFERTVRQLQTIKPKLIIALGNYAFWMLSSECRISKDSSADGRLVPSGIMDFRGSMLFTRPGMFDNPIPVLPLIHPAAILRAWELRTITIHDLRTRVPKALHNNWSPVRRPIIDHRPTFKELHGFFSQLLSQLDGGRKVKLANDIETRRELITCMCFATSATYAIVFPLINRDGDNIVSYWTVAEERQLTRLALRILSHPNAQIIGQNYLYDMTYLNRNYGIIPNCYHDTLSAQHLIWPGTQKDLGYLSSIYCEYHRYWKDDNKEWDAKSDLDSHLRYNGEDGLRTFEIHDNQLKVITQVNKTHLWEEEMEKHRMAFEMASYGLKVDLQMKGELALELAYASQERLQYLLKIVPQSMIDHWNGGPTYRKEVGQPKVQVFWPSSTTQQKLLFYDILGMHGQRHRKTKQPTLDKEAIPKLRKLYPWATKIFDALLELRSIEVFASTFVNARVDSDMRMRTSFNPAGTETFRWSSSKTPFNTGGNFQNLPKGKDL